jgi:hypothetical protein
MTAELRALLAKATEGPWNHVTDTVAEWIETSVGAHTVAKINLPATICPVDEQKANAALIVSLRNNASALLDEIEGLKRENAALSKIASAAYNCIVHSEDWDGDHIEDTLADAGMIKHAFWTEGVHEHVEGVEDGDKFWTITDFGRDILARAKEALSQSPTGNAS